MCSYQQRLDSRPFHGYKAFIALNNIGIALVRRQRYREAASTLRDALNVIKATAHHMSQSASDKSQEQQSSNGSYCSEEQIAELISKGSQLLARSSGSFVKTSIVEAVAVGTAKSWHPSFRICEISDETSPSLIISSIPIFDVSGTTSNTNAKGVSGSKEYTLFAIRMDCCDVDYENDEQVLETRSAILLYNFAVATRCHAEELLFEAEALSHSNPEKAKITNNRAIQSLQMVYKLFRMSYAVVSNYHRSGESDEANTDESGKPNRASNLRQNSDQILLVSILVLNQIVQMFRCGQLEMDPDYQMFVDCLQKMVAVVKAQSSRSSSLVAKRTAAAAA